MDPDFDMTQAVNEIGSGLGFDSSDDSNKGGEGDVDLQVDDASDAAGDDEAPDAPPAGDTPSDAVGEPDASTAESDTPAKAPTDLAVEPPKTWRKEAAAAWATLPPLIKQEVLKREEDIHRGLESYKADASFGKTVQGVLAPYMEALQAARIDPTQQIAGLMNAHYALAKGTPQQKLEMFQRLARDYGVPVGDQAPDEEDFTDPQVKALRSELEGIKSKLSTSEQQQAAQQRAALQAQIDKFSSDPARVHFQAVANDMARLLNSGVVSTLEEAYDKAVWLNPEVRAAELSRQTAEAAAKAKADAEEKARQVAKATSANVRTRAKSASATAPLGSIDDTLAATYAELTRRK